MEFRNAKYNEHGTIDMEINHEKFGWIPFTASSNDREEIGRILYDEAVVFGPEEYVPPTPEEARQLLPSLTRRQFKLGMRSLGITSEMITSAINNIQDINSREIAMIEWEEAQSYQRLHPLVLSLSVGFNITEDQLDTAWNYALSL